MTETGFMVWLVAALASEVAEKNGIKGARTAKLWLIGAFLFIALQSWLTV